MNHTEHDLPLYERIYAVARQIPRGKVATYGQVGALAGGISARVVGYAMAALRSGAHPDVPWQRVINAQGKISPHGFGTGSLVQRELLESEGVVFDAQARIDFDEFGWLGKP